MFRSIRVRSTAILAILTALPFIAAFAAIAVAVNHNADVAEQIRVAQKARATVLRLQLDEETSVSGYADSQNDVFLQPYRKAELSFDAALTALQAAVSQISPNVTAAAVDEGITHQRWIAVAAKPLIANPKIQTENNIQIEGKELIDRFRNDDDLIRTAFDRAAQRSDAFAKTIVYGIIGGGFLLGTGLLAFMVRIGQRQQYLAEQLEERNLSLEEADRSKDRFLANMSHELRTPLNAIIGFTGTMLMKLPGPLTEDQEEQLRIIQRSARHLLSLINDLLDLSRVQSGKLEVHLESVDARQIAYDVAAGLRALAEEKGLRLEFDPAVESLIVTSDKRKLSQILMNLGNNAIKYTENGFVRIKVSERRENGSRWIDFDVSDSGAGIDSTDQERIFEAFERLDNSITQKAPGSGLGLHLSYKLASIIGGRLTVRSQPGAGSTFTLSVPQN